MASSQHRICYGKMFPDPLHFRSDERVSGKVFGYELDTAGGVGRADRRVEVSMDGWDECRECAEFEHCYRLCLGSLALNAVIANE